MAERHAEGSVSEGSVSAGVGCAERLRSSFNPSPSQALHRPKTVALASGSDAARIPLRSQTFSTYTGQSLAKAAPSGGRKDPLTRKFTRTMANIFDTTMGTEQVVRGNAPPVPDAPPSSPRASPSPFADSHRREETQSPELELTGTATTTESHHTQEEVNPSPSRGPQNRFSKLNVKRRINLVLENSGSVARDHLASERTFLAYVRTSLAIASTGVALVQLFSIASSNPEGFLGNVQDIQRYARPLGALIIIFGMGVLSIGVLRYFAIQSALVKGQFPVARLVIGMISFGLGALIIVVFSMVLSGATK